MRKLRRLAVLVAILVAIAAAFLFTQQSGSNGSPASPEVTHTTFIPQRTTVITEPAGKLTLYFSPPLRMVLAVKATTDKGYFSLKCQGRGHLISVPGNGQTKSTTCRLVEVRYTDNSADTGTIVLQPQH